MNSAARSVQEQCQSLVDNLGRDALAALVLRLEPDAQTVTFSAKLPELADSRTRALLIFLVVLSQIGLEDVSSAEVGTLLDTVRDESLRLLGPADKTGKPNVRKDLQS